MSQENVDTVRELHDAFNRGDFEAASSALAEDVEWHPPGGVSIGSEVYRGRDVVQTELARWLGAWETYRFEPTEIVGQADRVLVSGTHMVRGRGSGVEVALPTFHVYSVRDGKITKMLSFDHRHDALEAAGIEE